MKSKKNIILLDDHSLYLRAMVLLIKEILPGHKVIGYKKLKQLLKSKGIIAKSKLVITDIELPGEDVFDLLVFLKESFPGLPVLVISMHKKIAVIRKCKALGVEGYILKDEDDLLSKAIEIIIKGGTYYSPKVNGFYRKAQTNHEKLSPREEEIIKYIYNGCSNKDIADKLFISVETVKTHKKNIRLKLELETTEDVINYVKTNYLL